MRSGISARQHLIYSFILLFLTAVLTSANGFRISSSLFREADPFEDAIMVDLDGNREALMVKRSQPAETSGLWFGPRLGRRDKRSLDDTLDVGDSSKEEEIFELLRETPWALIPLKGSNRQKSFIPRLGREFSEEEVLNFEQRSPPLTPRLGRRLVPFTPRMGRDFLPQDFYFRRFGRSISSPQLQD